MILIHLSSSWFSLENTSILQCLSRHATKHLSILSEKRLSPSADFGEGCFGLSRYLHFLTTVLFHHLVLFLFGNYQIVGHTYCCGNMSVGSLSWPIFVDLASVSISLLSHVVQ